MREKKKKNFGYKKKTSHHMMSFCRLFFKNKLSANKYENRIMG